MKRQTCAVAIRRQRDYIDSKQERYHWMHIRSNRYYIEEKAAIILDAYMYGRYSKRIEKKIKNKS